MVADLPSVVTGRVRTDTAQAFIALPDEHWGYDNDGPRFKRCYLNKMQARTCRSDRHALTRHLDVILHRTQPHPDHDVPKVPV